MSDPPQSEIPDDLKPDRELSADVIRSVAALRHLAVLFLRAIDDLIEALERVD